MRTLVDVAAGGTFSGVLTGGNGRGALAASDYYQFSVPARTKALRAELALHDNPAHGNVRRRLPGQPGRQRGGPTGRTTTCPARELGITDPTLTATALNPAAGLWTLIVAFAEPVPGTEVADPFTGSVAFTSGRAGGPGRQRCRRAGRSLRARPSPSR